MKSGPITIITLGMLLFSQLSRAGDIETIIDSTQSSWKQNATQRGGAHGAPGQKAGPGGQSPFYTPQIPGSIANRSELSYTQLVHPLSCPLSFDKDGVYIWRDPDGLWTIFWRGAHSFDVAIEITGSAPVVVKSLAGQATRVLDSSEFRIKLMGRCDRGPGIAQVFATSEQLSFTVLINGQPAPDQIFHGADLESPASHKFTLDYNQDATQASQEAIGALVPFHLVRPPSPLGQSSANHSDVKSEGVRGDSTHSSNRNGGEK